MNSDLSLIEIAGEDDSLLHPTPLAAAADDAFFLVSPLQPPRSRPKEVAKANVDRDRDGMNKQNTNLNKIEENKFSLQPQQMKRKKKGGFNMRKSLAWDRAFFEEEGVLNSEELSMITGSGNFNSSGSLSVIEEEASCGGDSAYLQDLEENIFKVISGSTPKKDRISGGSPLPKHASPARDNAVPGSAGRRKVLSAHDSNRSGSKRSGCPRPMVSSSLKRPANVNTIKSATKEPKVSKLPIPKPVPCALSKTSKNVTVGATDLKRNQIASHVNLNNSKTGLHNAKVGPMGKSSTAKGCTRPTRRNVVNNVKSSPTKAQCPLVTEANNGLEVIKKRSLPSTSQTSYGRGDRCKNNAILEEVTLKQTLPPASHASYSCDEQLRKVAVSLPHTGLNLPHTQLQTSKPSGLRMPSPSLSYFNQTKASCLPGTHKSSSQPHKSPNVRQIGSVNPIYNLRPLLLEKIPNKTNAGTVIENIDVQCSSSVPSVITAATDKVDSVSQLRQVQKELKLRFNSKGNGMTGDHKKINSMEDVIFQSDDKYLMDQESSLAFPEKSIEIQGHILERVADANSEVHNSSAAEYKILDALSYSRCKDQTKDESSALKRISRISNLDDAEMLDSDRKLCEVNDVNDCRSNEVEMVDSPNVENIALVSGDNGPDEECHRYNTGNNEDICLEVKLSVASGLQSNPDLLKYVNLEEEANQEVDDRIDVIKEPLPGDLSTVANCTHSNTHELSGFLDLRHPNAIAVQVSQEHKPKSDLNGALHPNNTSCKEYEDMDELVLDWLDGCESDPKLSNACIVVTSAIYDGRPDLGAEVDYSNLELAVTRRSMVEQSPENVHDHTISRDSNVLCDQAAFVESDLSLKTTNEEDFVRTLACNSLEGKSPSLFDQTSPSGSILQDNGVIVLGSKTLAEDAETSILRSNHTVNDEMQHELDDSVNSPRDNEAVKELKKSMSGKKQEGLVIIPPSNAVPFSDEWLAAIEAAGEEILTKKGGAVQNSPPNKSPPQLGPYSPVKRKQKQVIGPFDCTKHINPP